MSRTITEAFRLQASGDQNKPLELIDIYLDDTKLYFVANNTENIEFFNAISGDAVTYTTAPIGREAIESSLGMDIDKVRIGLANIDRVMVQYLQAREFRGKRIIIRQIFADDIDSSGDAVILFDGLMDTPSVDQDWVSVACVQRLSSLQRKAPGRWYQLHCNWKFGSTECGINKTISPYVKAKTCDALCTTTVIKGADIDEPTNRWRQGYIKFTSGANENIRVSIASNSAGQLTLAAPLPYAPAHNDTYFIYAGCDKTLAMCSGDWANEANFGGFNTIPENMVVRTVAWIFFSLASQLSLYSILGGIL